MSRKGDMDHAYHCIYDFFQGNITEDDLTDVHRKILARWQGAFAIMRNYESINDTIPKLVHQYKISASLARQDCVYAQKLFGNIHASNKEGLRHLLTEWTKDIIFMARSKTPPDLKEMNNAIRNLAMLNGLDKEDPDKIDFSKLEKHENPINLPEDVMQLLMSLVGRGALDLTAFRKSLEPTPIDIPHKEILD